MSAGQDTNDVGLDELKNFCGTSASTPFVAGIVGLMKAANPLMSTEQVLEALQASANPSPLDPLVARGYVDAFRAVERALPNARPSVTGVTPSFGTVVGWARHPRLSVTYTDPETPTIEAAYRWRGRVSFRSDRNGLLCVATVPPYACDSTPDALRLGFHRILVRATDAFGATRTRHTLILVVNRRPAVTIGSPAAGATLYSHLPARLSAHVTDPDEPVSGVSVRWRSSRDGFLGSGTQLNKLLSAGHHVLTVEAVDAKGASSAATRAVDVLSGSGLPTPLITAPTCCGPALTPGQAVTLRGHATDPEDGPLTGASLRWSSNVDGFLGTGEVLTVTLSGPAVPCIPSSSDIRSRCWPATATATRWLPR
jgi:Subtilase family